jgi:hypothetical protein
MSASSACICVLLYGGQSRHEALARRVLNASLLSLDELAVEYRFGLNAVSPATREFVQTCAAGLNNVQVMDGPNIYKYPMMRKLFSSPVTTAPITMWFDHDSYLDLPPVDVKNWFFRVQRLLNSCDMLGSVYRGCVTDAHAEIAQSQSWGVGCVANRYISYALGGWWAIRTSVLKDYNWPPEELTQKNGDVLLGELFAQQKLSLTHFRDGVKINVNADGVEGAEPRTITQ